MKIISKGEEPSFTKQFKCTLCKTIFEADKGEYEIADTMAQQRDRVTAYCKCPVCGRSVCTYD